jgi:hypothetical protein
MKNWLHQFPRLNSLYERSDRSDPENYFNAPSFEVNELWPPFLKWVEQHLQRLDNEAWEQLVAKALPEVCRRDPRRGWSQLWSVLHEAMGYALLADRGYTNIRFVDRGDEKTPDLLGESPTSRAIVEVKTVNCSDEDIDRLNSWPPIALDMGSGLSLKFKEKLEKTIDVARTQLRQYGEPTDKRVILVVVSLDSNYKFIGQNYAELREFVAAQQCADVELVHQVIS